MANKLPKKLVDAIGSGVCLPFVGAGVSMAIRDCNGNKVFPGWGELLISAANALDENNKTKIATLVRASLDVDSPDYGYVASLIRKNLGPLWYEYLKNRFDHSLDVVDKKSLNLAKAVWSLGSKMVITTNYDRVLRWACPSQTDVQIWDIQAPVEMIKNHHNKYVVWHLHGSIENSANIILESSDYEKLYAGDVDNQLYKAANHCLKEVIRSRNILFIGFSGADEYVSGQINYMAKIFDDAPGPHYILIHKKEIEKFNSYKIKNLEPVVFDDYGESLIDLILHKNSGKIETNKKNETSEAVKQNRRKKTVAVNIGGYVNINTKTYHWDQGNLDYFRKQIRLEMNGSFPVSIGDVDFLNRIGCLHEKTLNVAGVLLFANLPSIAEPELLGSAVVQCTKYEGSSKSSPRSARIKIDGSVVRQMTEAHNFVLQQTPHVEFVLESTMQAELDYKFPMICVRELIANAVCHRDYSDQARIIYVTIFDDRIEIKSPGQWGAKGRLVNHPKQIDQLVGESVQRNMLLAQKISMISFVEMEGSGLVAANMDCSKKMASLPIFKEEDGYVVVAIFPRNNWGKGYSNREHVAIDISHIKNLELMLQTSKRDPDKSKYVENSIRLARHYEDAGNFQRSFEILMDAQPFCPANNSSMAHILKRIEALKAKMSN